MALTLFDKIWQRHLVTSIPDGPDVLYIDRHYIHEVTSPQAFAGLQQRGLSLFRPERIVATADHNVPTIDQHLPIRDALSRLQVDQLVTNCRQHGVTLYGLGHPNQGIVHVIGPELGLTLPGMTIVCGDSHTSTHGAFGTIAFGIGTSEVEMVFATQCLMQSRPKRMRIRVEGDLKPGVVAKDLILHIIARLGAGGATGYFVEYAGSAIRGLSMEARMTVCNMSIEMGARGGLIAPDATTFRYLEGRVHAPAGAAWEAALADWSALYSDEDAAFDEELYLEGADIAPMITWGTNPGQGVAVSGQVPGLAEGEDGRSVAQALQYMGLTEGQQMEGLEIQHVFIGSCTNSRIEDLRQVARLIEGKRKHPNVRVLVVPGSQRVSQQVRSEGLDKIFEAAGFEFRQAGCSACLGMNEDKVPAGDYCVSTSNRNFEGRQGAGARTLLASPLTAAAAALTGRVTDVRKLVDQHSFNHN